MKKCTDPLTLRIYFETILSSKKELNVNSLKPEFAWPRTKFWVKKPSFCCAMLRGLTLYCARLWSIAFEWRVLYSADGAWFMAGGEFSGLGLILAGSVSGICLIWPGSESFVRICRPADCSIQSFSQKELLQNSLLTVDQFQKSDNFIFARKTLKAKFFIWLMYALLIWSWSVSNIKIHIGHT